MFSWSRPGTKARAVGNSPCRVQGVACPQSTVHHHQWLSQHAQLAESITSSDAAKTSEPSSSHQPRANAIHRQVVVREVQLCQRKLRYINAAPRRVCQLRRQRVEAVEARSHHAGSAVVGQACRPGPCATGKRRRSRLMHHGNKHY